MTKAFHVPNPSGSDADAFRDLARAVRLLEHQFDAYQRLHDEDMASLRSALTELKARLAQYSKPHTEPSSSQSHTLTFHTKGETP